MYRSDLEAAQRRIAALEQELADARRALTTRADKPRMTSILPLALAAIAGLGVGVAILGAQRQASERAHRQAVEGLQVDLINAETSASLARAEALAALESVVQSQDARLQEAADPLAVPEIDDGPAPAKTPEMDLVSAEIDVLDSATGEITIVSTPPAYAVLDDKRFVGETPVTVRVDEGRHTVALVGDGQSVRKTVAVRGGQRQQVDWQWSPR